MKWFGVIALSAVAISCSDEEHDRVWWDNEKTIIELTNQLELEQLRAKMTLGLTETHPVSEETPDPVAIESEIALLISQKGSLEKEVSQLVEGWNGFRRSVLIEKRSSVNGTSYKEYDPGNGKIYHDVTVTAIDDSGVSIRHSKGTARLRFEDLDLEGCVNFGLDEQFSHDALRIEREHRIAYEKWIEKGMAAKEAERLAAAETRKREEERLQAQRRLAALNTASNSVNTSPLTASFGKLGETKEFSRRSYYYSNYYGTYGTRRSTYYRYYTPTQVSPSIYSSPSTYGNGIYVQPPCGGTSIYDYNK